MALFMVVCTCVMYGFLINHMMSFYYYFKIYYNLWLFGWLLCVMAADILADENSLQDFMHMLDLLEYLRYLLLQIMI